VTAAGIIRRRPQRKIRLAGATAIKAVIAVAEGFGDGDVVDLVELAAKLEFMACFHPSDGKVYRVGVFIACILVLLLSLVGEVCDVDRRRAARVLPNQARGATGIQARRSEGLPERIVGETSIEGH